MYSKTKKEVEKRHEAGKKYMRAKEVATYLSVGLSTVWMYANIGKITPLKLSKRVTVFKIDELDKLKFEETEKAWLNPDELGNQF